MVLDQNSIELIGFAGAALGIAGRTVMPYLKARTEANENLKFETKYIFSAAYAAILSIAGSFFLWPQLMPALSTSMSTFAIFVLSFTTGWTSNDIANYIQSSLTSNEAISKLETTTTTKPTGTP